MTSDLPCGRQGGSGQGGAEHVNERTCGCVSERAEATTRAWAVLAVAAQ
jgi:hypothetical protein